MWLIELSWIELDILLKFGVGVYLLCLYLFLLGSRFGYDISIDIGFVVHYLFQEFYFTFSLCVGSTKVGK